MKKKKTPAPPGEVEAMLAECLALFADGLARDLRRVVVQFRGQLSPPEAAKIEAAIRILDRQAIDARRITK